MDLLEQVAKDTYEFEKVMCNSGMSFSDPRTVHARSFYEKKVVTSSSPFIPEYVPPMFYLCYYFDHNSDSCPPICSIKS